MTNNWKANNLRKSIILDPHRFKVVVAGRRWGKSYLSLMWLLTKEIQPGERRWICGPTYRSLKSTTWPILRSLMRQHEGAVINESDLSIKLPNDSEIALKGSEQENNLRGAGLDMVVMEEFSYIKPHVYEEII